MNKKRRYLTKKHLLALLGLALAMAAFVLYSFLISSTSNPPETGTFEPIEAQSPGSLESPEDDPSSDDRPEQDTPKVYSFSEARNIDVLVNKDYRLPQDYIPEGLQVPDIATEDKTQLELSVRPEAASALEDLFAAAKQEGLNMLLASGYRSYATQASLFTNAGGEGNTLVAPPGASEHQTGLAADISGSNRSCRLEVCFGEDPEGQWLANNAHNFGFIVRYPADRTEDTGYSYEPWHLRYVGKSLAQRIFDQDLILEEV